MTRGHYILTLFLLSLLSFGQKASFNVISDTSTLPEFKYKNKFVIKWPIKTFVYEGNGIYFEKHYLPIELLSKIANLEPDLNKKSTLLTQINLVNKYRKKTKTIQIVSAIIAGVSLGPLYAGLATKSSGLTIAGLAGFGTGAVGEFYSIPFGKKKRKAYKGLEVLFNN